MRSRLVSCRAIVCLDLRLELTLVPLYSHRAGPSTLSSLDLTPKADSILYQIGGASLGPEEPQIAALEEESRSGPFAYSGHQSQSSSSEP